MKLIDVWYTASRSGTLYWSNEKDAIEMCKINKDPPPLKARAIQIENKSYMIVDYPIDIDQVEKNKLKKIRENLLSKLTSDEKKSLGLYE